MKDKIEFQSLNVVSKTIKELADKIGAEKDDLPTFGYSDDFARPFIEVDHNGYHFVIVERGREIKRLSSRELNVFLYFVFENITRLLALRYELKHRTNKLDFRRIYFAKQENLLDQLNHDWSQRLHSEHSQILKEYPFDDFADARTNLCEEYRKEGMSAKNAWKLACDKYPLNSS